MSDPFDPANWTTLLLQNMQQERRIYGDDMAQIYAVVDEEDYQHCLQWLWSPKWSRGGRKFYLRRLLSKGEWRERTRHTRFLHTEIMLRKGDVPPCLRHNLIDHLDGDSMNCRRSNLRWATGSMNRVNIFGKHADESLSV